MRSSGLLLLLVAACDDPPAAVPEVPVRELPQLQSWSCPAAWHAIPAYTDAAGVEDVPEGLEAVTACAPPAQLACPDGEAQFLGESSCSPIGTACPTGMFHDEAFIQALAPGHAGRVLYVSPGASGDGSRVAPFGSLMEAFDAVRAGDIVALSEGTFAGFISMHRHSAWVGSCAGGTVVLGPAPVANRCYGAAEIVGLEPGIGRLANLTLGGAGSCGMLISTSDMEAELQSVEILDPTGAGVLAFDAPRMRFDRVVMRRLQRTIDGNYGGSIVVGSFGPPVHATLTRIVVEEGLGLGVWVATPDVTALLEDIVVRDMRSRESDGRLGRGIVIGEGTEVELRRALVERAREVGMAVEKGASARGSDIVVRDTLGETAGDRGGVGLMIIEGSGFTGERIHVDGSRVSGIGVGRPIGTPSGNIGLVFLSDILVTDTAVGTPGGYGHGVTLSLDTQAILSRLIVDRASSIGLFCAGVATACNVSDVIVRRTQLDLAGDQALGAAVAHSAQFFADRMLVDDTIGAGVLIANGETFASFTSLTVTESGSRPRDGLGGAGVAVVSEGQASFALSALLRNRGVGLLAVGSAFATLTDLQVLDTQQLGCADFPVEQPEHCESKAVPDAAGSGLMAGDGGVISVARFEVAGSEQAGLRVAAGGAITASDGDVHDNLIGISVADDAFNYEGIADSVTFRDNAVKLDASALPVPDILNGIDVPSPGTQ